MYRITTTLSKTQSLNTYLGYRCSNCFNPLIRKVQVIASDRGTTSVRTDIVQEMSRELTVMTKTAMNSIKTFFQDPSVVEFPDNEDFSILGLDEPCPVCGYKEIWQFQEFRPFIKSAPDVTLFDSLEETFEWAQDQIEEQKKNSEAAKEYQIVHSNYKSFKSELEELKLKSMSGEEPESKRVSELKKKEQELLQRFSEINYFGKEKQYAKDALDQCRKELEKAERDYQESIEPQSLTRETKNKHSVFDLKLLREKYADCFTEEDQSGLDNLIIGSLKQRVQELQLLREEGSEIKNISALKEKERELHQRFSEINSFGKEKKLAKDALDQCRQDLVTAEQEYKQNVVFRTLAEQATIQCSINAMEALRKKYTDHFTVTENKSSIALHLLEIDESSDSEKRYAHLPLPEILSFHVSDYDKDNEETIREEIVKMKRELRKNGRRKLQNG